MATYANTLTVPRGFSRPTDRNLPTTWVPTTAGFANSLTIETLAVYLTGVDPVTYSPARLASMTVNDMRYAQNMILNQLP